MSVKSPDLKFKNLICDESEEDRDCNENGLHISVKSADLKLKNLISDESKEEQNDQEKDCDGDGIHNSVKSPDMKFKNLISDEIRKEEKECNGNGSHITVKSPDMKFKNLISDESKEEEEKACNGSGLHITLEKLNLGPKKKLLVLCLGGLLVHRVHRRHWDSVRGLKPDLRSDKFLVFKRPFCTEFMQFCFERFEVGIWSAATEHNIDVLLTSITGAGMENKLSFVWGQEECIDSGYHCIRNVEKPLFLKDLRQLWEKKYLNLPWRRGQYSSSNTLLIDDDPHIGLLNPPTTGIYPRPYKGHNNKDTFLGPNGWLRIFLRGLADANDVPSYVKEHRFGYPPITPSHSDWHYYSKIVREFGKEGKNGNEVKN